MNDPFHDGERQAQSLANVETPPFVAGIRDFMPDQHREFFAGLPYLFVGALDEAGRPTATVLAGEPGFIASPDPRTLEIALDAPGDPVAERLTPGAEVGMLGLDLSNRRRNRVNGVVAARQDGRLTIDVLQSFGNCPQYIQTRLSEIGREPPGPVEPFDGLDAEAQQTLAITDTLFVASHASGPNGGVDISHRGGLPGFVRREGAVLTIPDYRGNRFFNTLGNLIADPRAALLLVDFQTGDLTVLQGRAEVLWEPPGDMPKAERAWTFTVERGQRRRRALPLRWAFGAFASTTLATGGEQAS